MEKLPILNIEVHNWKFDDFLAQLEEGVVLTPNTDHFIKLQKDHEFYLCYQEAEHIVCDSRTIQLLLKVLPGKGIVEQIAGSDLFPAYCYRNRNNTEAVKVFLLGGTEDSVKVAQQTLNKNDYTNAKCCIIRHIVNVC